MVVGAVQFALHLSGYWGVGPSTNSFHNSPYTIGFAEAHGLAILVGILLRWPARREPRRYWHLLGLVTHVLLGGANILFWASFTTFDMVVPGVLATIVHLVLVIAQSWAWLTWSRDAGG